MVHLNRLKSSLRRFIYAFLVMLLLAGVPVQLASAASITGPGRPVGADSGMFHRDATTGTWGSKYYTWDAATDQRIAKPQPYTYNTATGKWDTTQWSYSASAGKYVSTIVSVSNLPPGAVATNSPPIPTAPAAEPTTKAAPSNTITPNENGNKPVVSADASQATTLTNTTNATMNNQIGVTSQSGNVSVNGNTNGGSATSGDASALVNILNLLQSSASLDGSGASTFVANVEGDIQGDIIIDPSVLAQSTIGSLSSTNNLQVKNQVNGQINNTIDVAADSGDANVSHNTSAGDATSGSATAMVNVMNMINSIIAAHQSFIGVVNIRGNLNGNVLVPSAYLQSLLADNADGQPSSTTNGNTTATTDIAQTNNTTITNNVNTSATSGGAATTNNTSAGSATSGESNTKVTLLNLSGSHVTGSNCLLVFVNVFGHWVGLIMDAPAGSTAAVYGGNGTTLQAANLNTDVNSQNKFGITNDINASATSGAAAVNDNTKAGSASSGNANVAVNVLNITNSQVGLSGWFGVLFINVFGDWIGNFGVTDPSPPPTPTQPTVTRRPQPTPKSVKNPSLPAVFRFVPNQAAATPLTNGFALTKHVSKILGAAIPPTPTKASAAEAIARQQDHAHDILIGAGLVGAGILVFAIEQVISRRKQRS